MRTGSRPSTPTGRSSWPLPEAIAAASPARREELCRIVVEQVVVDDRVVEDIKWPPTARPRIAGSVVVPPSVLEGAPTNGFARADVLRGVRRL
jgi:hypothetical protein